MALEYFTGFDYYTSTDCIAVGGFTTATFNTGGVTTSVFRTGTRGMLVALNDTLAKQTGITSTATAILGMAFRPNQIGFNGQTYGGFISMSDSSTNQITVGMKRTTGELVLWNGASVAPGAQTSTAPVATSTNTMTIGTFYFMEIVLTVANSGGTVDIYVDGTNWLSYTGDTQNSANATVNGFKMAGTGTPSQGSFYCDDVYWVSGTGGSNTTRLGDVHVDAIFSSAEGNTIDWTPSTGSDNEALIDETTENGDTDFNSTSTINAKDTFTWGNTTSAGTVYGVGVRVVAKKQTAGTCTISPVVRHSSIDNIGTAATVTTSYTDVGQIYETNPGTGLAWTTTDIDNAEFGYKRIS